MSKSKKPIIYITCFFLVLSSVIIPYYNSKASELVVASGLASTGVGLLGLLAMSGVGMEVENNKRFNDLSDEEKARIENGLVQDYNEVALQRGASLEKIKTWTNDLCNGVLDKASDCYSIFKDWAKNIDIKSVTSQNPADDYPVGKIPLSVAFPYTIYDTSNDFVATVTMSDILSLKPTFNFDREYSLVSLYYTSPNSNNNWYKITALCAKYVNGNIVYDVIPICEVNLNGEARNPYGSISTTVSRYPDYFYPQYMNSALKGFVCYGNNNMPMMLNGVMVDNSNDYGQLGASTSIFKTNTDYLERLQGQEKEQVEVIDVTDIKNPIVESKGNSIARIDWNRGTNNNNNNDDDEQTIKGGLVPADVWYESLDDYIDGQNNAIESYDEHIAENPEDKDKYFISPSPIVNISQFYDVLPVVPVPTAGTIVNNYYTYNNYNTFNNTIYNEPYNPELVPNIPMLVFENKFPFCIPWDIFNFISAFYVEKEAPKIDIPFPIKGANGIDIQTVTIDLSGYEYLSTIIRVMFFVLFLVGLMILTRQLIKG